jgi:hypothetical protein
MIDTAAEDTALKRNKSTDSDIIRKFMEDPYEVCQSGQEFEI